MGLAKTHLDHAWLEKLTKLLNLSRSDNDHEALSALRMANQRLSAANLSWSDLLSAAPAPKTAPPKTSDEVRIDILINDFRLTDWEVNFLESIRQSLARFGSLTTKQRAVLDRIWRAYGR